jgi:hypothetical protein
MQISKHAEIRSQQRAVGNDVLKLIWEHHDAEVYVGHGVYALRLTEGYATTLTTSAVAPKRTVERARDTAVLIGEDGETIVTVIKGGEGRSFKTYTRPRKGTRGRRRRKGR